MTASTPAEGAHPHTNQTMLTTLRSYHGKPAVKAKYLARVRAHQRADQIVQGLYVEGTGKSFRGCAVGCTIHGDDHSAYERKLGIPQMVAQLEDRIFEGLPTAKAKLWPARFLRAIPVGADLSRVGPKFLLALQERRLAAMPAGDAFGVRSALGLVIDVLRQWADTGAADESAARIAESAAESAARIAESAAESAASAAWIAVSAAESAASAARSAASAAWIAVSAAVSAGSAASAASAAESAEYVWQAETLLTLLRNAPVTKRSRRKVA